MAGHVSGPPCEPIKYPRHPKEKGSKDGLQVQRERVLLTLELEMIETGGYHGLVLFTGWGWALLYEFFLGSVK